jgi:hypothetical protein
MSDKNYVLNGAPHGEVATQLMSGVALSDYRTLASLPKRAWESVDQTIIRVAKDQMPGIADLNRAPGVAVNFNGLSASTYTMWRASKMSAAHVSMTPDTRGESDILDFDSISVPLPVTVKDFWVNTKQVSMAATEGVALATYAAEEATYQVANLVEGNLFNGSYSAAGSTLYGYMTFPDRKTHPMPLPWADPSGTLTLASPSEIFSDINTMISIATDQNHFGPFMLYVPWRYMTRLNEDYLVADVGGATAPSVTIKDRLMMLTGLQGITASKFLPVIDAIAPVNPETDNIMLVEMSPRTVKLLNGMTMTAIDWEPPGSPNWNHNFKVITMAVPMMLSDYDGNCGIIHGTYTVPV